MLLYINTKKNKQKTKQKIKHIFPLNQSYEFYLQLIIGETKYKRLFKKIMIIKCGKKKKLLKNVEHSDSF